MGLSIWQLLIVLVIVLVLFGGSGKLSSLMGDAGKGIKAFKSGLGGDKGEAEADTKQIKDEPAAAKPAAPKAEAKPAPKAEAKPAAKSDKA
ncbi:twin-arginine translocase TatA/TatE family subunit [Roseospirillum parvum]|uniref:Sec-independent protein translocase protein TatA n=1 Tax=Roseospirillum parvum TaxID=83401 RepID=A0A1G7YHX0_9PROT|nr:twin-arginine translocase TatA/TatE family subunit [Roseospirillum parvum]SDG96103.1 sec-independent protein translocase protein TatA [Roseospirillum parvum]